MHKKLIVLLTSIGLLFSGGSGGSWIEDWLYPDTGLFFWAVITFLIVFAVLRWKAWGPLMDTLEAREQQIQDSLNNKANLLKLRGDLRLVVLKGTYNLHLSRSLMALKKLILH